MLEPLMDVGIIMPNHLDVAAEKRMVCCIKSDDCGVPKTDVSGIVVERKIRADLQSNIRLCKMFTEDEWTFAVRKNLLHTIKTFKEYLYVFFVSLLGCSEARLTLLLVGELEGYARDLPYTRHY